MNEDHRSETFKKIVNELAREMVTAEHREGASFVKTPILYPSGTTVVVKIDEGQNEFFVSDMGLGFQEADMMGGSRIYPRYGRQIAETNGIGFDNHSFFVIRASKEQLAGAVMAVANCSQQAAAIVSQRVSKERANDAAEELLERLLRIFKPEQVEQKPEIFGASDTPYEFTAIVRNTKASLPTIFEPVINHPNSIATVVMKFNDVARLELPPHRVAVTHDKDRFGTFLGVLSQTADVINDNVPDRTYRQLALAA